jgi:hypothetical protein
MINYMVHSTFCQLGCWSCGQALTFIYRNRKSVITSQNPPMSQLNSIRLRTSVSSRSMHSPSTARSAKCSKAFRRLMGPGRAYVIVLPLARLSTSHNDGDWRLWKIHCYPLPPRAHEPMNNLYVALRFSDRQFVYIHHLIHACYMARQFNLHRHSDSFNITLSVQIVKYFLAWYSPYSVSDL